MPGSTADTANKALADYAQHRDTLAGLRERGYFERPVDSLGAKVDWAVVTVAVANRHGTTPDLSRQPEG